MFKKYFEYQIPNEMLDNLLSLDNVKGNEAAVKISNNFKYLSDKAKELSLNEKANENIMLKIVEVILEFTRQQQGQGLKILMPDQMFSRLLISLAQLNAGNNSDKLKNEIRLLLYFLYRSKKFTKQLYKSLIDII